MRVHLDNQQCIGWTRETTRVSRAIDVKLHAVQDLYRNGEFELLKLNTESQLADMMTKNKPGNQTRSVMRKIG